MPDPVSRGGRPVCWVKMRPLTGEAVAEVFALDVEFLMEARYGLAVVTASAHVIGSLLMTVAGVKSAVFWMAQHG